MRAFAFVPLYLVNRLFYEEVEDILSWRAQRPSSALKRKNSRR